MARSFILAALALAVLAVPTSAAAATTALTRDLDGDGRVDAVSVRTSAGQKETVEIAEHAGVDTAALPRVPCHSLRQALGRRTSCRVSVRDGAAPVLMDARREGKVVRTTWSEPVRLVRRGRAAVAVEVRDRRGRALRASKVQASSRELLVQLSDAIAAEAVVVRSGRSASIADRRGNRAAADTARLRDAGSPATAVAGAGGSTAPASRKSQPRPTGAPAASSPTTAPTAPRSPAPGDGEAPALGTDAFTDGFFAAANQTSLAFGDRSHWLQPWRGYLETVPATRLRDALGINFDVRGSEAFDTARVLAHAGFRRARVEIGWNNVAWSEDRLTSPDIEAKLSALVANGIRPLILLNAHHGSPGPVTRTSLRVTASAAEGARTLRLSPDDVPSIRPGFTGLDALDGSYKAADVLISSVRPDGTATLAKPLPQDVSAGTFKATTLKYRPFAPPQLSDGRPNPAFEETLAGWLRYVDLVTREVKRLTGATGFDLEVWNELSFGSDFLNLGKYDAAALAGTGGAVDDALLRRTVAFVREPARGLAGVGVTSGFASQRPWDAADQAPSGLTAFSKHPYPVKRTFPQDAVYNGVRPIDAAGRAAGRKDASGRWVDNFVPSYTSLFPEYYLSAIQTEHLVRDISPIITTVYDRAHGRFSGTNGTAAPETWITELNVDLAKAGLSADDARRVQTKSALRSLVSYVNKGVGALHFFAAKHPGLNMIDSGFFTPQRGPAGQTMEAFGRLTAAFAGAESLASVRQLKLDRVRGGTWRQFDGDGTSAHPPLLNRDVVGFFPFQRRADDFVVAAYVMTRDVTKDLAAERYDLTIGGVDGANVKATATDPLTGATVAVEIVQRGTATVTIRVPLTDSPRLVSLTGA